MVGVLIRMKWRMLRHATTGSRAGLTGFGALLGTALAAAGVVGVLARPDRAGGVAVAVTTAWTVGWVVSATIAGGESMLRVRSFALLPIPPRRLAVGLSAAAFVGVGPVVTLLAFVAPVLYAARLGTAAVLLAIPAVGLQLAFLVLASRVVVELLGEAMRSRLGMETAAAVFGFAIAFLYAGWGTLGLLGGAVDNGSPLLRALPSGWAVAAIAAAGSGRWLAAVLPLLGLAASGVLLMLGWARLLGRRLVTAESASTARSRPAGRRLLPATPFRASLGKELRHWWRDPHRGRLIRMALWTGVFVVVLSPFGMSFYLPWAGCLAVLYAAALCANLYGFDGSGLWLVLAVPGAARVDLRARQVAWLLVVGPVALGLTIVGTALFGQSWAWPWTIGLTTAILGGAAGFVAWYSVSTLAPMTDPHRRARGALVAGDDIDAGRAQSQGQAAFWSTLLSTVPPAVVLAAGALTRSAMLTWLGAAVGVGTGVALAWWLGRLAQRRLEATGPELVTAMRRGPSASLPGAARTPQAQLPRRIAVPAGLLMLAGILMTFPQGLVPVAFAVLGVDHRVRVWFLARYLPMPYQVPVAVAFVVVGCAAGTAAALIVRRYRRHTADQSADEVPALAA